MRRRQFFGFVVWAASAKHAVAQGKTHRIVLVHPSAAPIEMHENGSLYYRTLLGELRQHGYVEGANLIIKRRSGGGRSDAYHELARQVVALEPDLIYADSRRLAQHIKAATVALSDVGSAVYSLAAEGVGGLLILSSPLFPAKTSAVAALTTASRLRRLCS